MVGEPTPLTYKDAGVDIDAVTGALRSVGEMAASTHTDRVLTGIGSFGALFRAAQKEGLHTCLDTNGYVKKYTDDIKAMVDATDLVLLDIKQMNDAKHIELTRISNRYTLKFARYLADIDKAAWIRYVVLPGYTDSKEDIIALGEFLQPMGNIKRVELLPFHQVGAHKWAVFKDDYALKDAVPPSKKKLDKIVARLATYGIKARY